MSSKPFYGQLCDGFDSLGGNQPGQPLFQNQPCAFWMSKGRNWGREEGQVPRIVAQLALDIQLAATRMGWTGWPEIWTPGNAMILNVKVGNTAQGSFMPISGGPMWQGTADAHYRYNCTPFNSFVAPPAPAFVTGLPGGFATTCDLYRPFGAAQPTKTGIVAIYYPDLPRGRGSYSGGNYLIWDAAVAVASNIDVRDGCSRASGLDTIVYEDGDELRIPSGAQSTPFVVVYVQNALDANGKYYKLVYLLRDQAHWPGPITTP